MVHLIRPYPASEHQKIGRYRWRTWLSRGSHENWLSKDYRLLPLAQGGAPTDQEVHRRHARSCIALVRTLKLKHRHRSATPGQWSRVRAFDGRPPNIPDDPRTGATRALPGVNGNWP